MQRAITSFVIAAIFVAAANTAYANLVGVWQFEDAGNLGQDSSSYGNDLGAFGDAVSQDPGGKYGSALSLGGSADYLALESSPGVENTTAVPSGFPVGNSDYALAAWIKPTAIGDRGIIGWGNYGGGRQVNALRLMGSNNFRHYWWSADLDASAGGTNLLDGNWHHIVATYSDAINSRALWLDGQILAFDRPGDNNAQPQRFRLGNTFGTENFLGSLDDVAVFNSPLNPSQIQAVMAGDFTLANSGRVAAGHWVGDDYSGSGTWTNRNAAFNDAVPDPTSEGNRNNLPAAGVAVNSHGSVFFDANDDANLNTGASFEVAGSAAVASGGTNPTSGARAISFTAVFQTRDGVGGRGGPHWQNSGLFGNERPGGGRGDWGVTYQDGTASGFQSDTEVNGTSTDFNNNAPRILTYTIDSAGLVSLWLDGQLQATGIADFVDNGPTYTLETTDSGFSIGASTGAGLNGGDTGFIHGDMSEARIDSFQSVGAPASANLDQAETVIVHNHLSSKYGSALLANDKYSGDTAAAGDYDNGVFGIARVGSASVTAGDDAWLSSLASSGLSIAEVGSSLADGEAVLAGHADFIGSSVPASSWVTSGLPSGIFTRLDRTWFVEETGDVDFTLTFDLGDLGVGAQGLGFKLLTADTSALNFNVEGLLPVISGDEITFDLTGFNMPAGNTGYFTLGGAVVPEPSTFVLAAMGLIGLALVTRRRRRAS